MTEQQQQNFGSRLEGFISVDLELGQEILVYMKYLVKCSHLSFLLRSPKDSFLHPLNVLDQELNIGKKTEGVREHGISSTSRRM